MREGGYLREECRDPYAFVKATAHGMGSAKRKGAGIGKEQASGTLPRWSRMRHAVDPAPRRTIANAQPAAASRANKMQARKVGEARAATKWMCFDLNIRA